MITSRFNIFGKDIYIATKLESILDERGNEVFVYDTPKKYHFNVQPIQSNTELEAYGIVGSGAQKAICPRNIYEGMFKEYDAVYLDGANPDGESENGANANYRIKGEPLNQNLLTVIIFEKL